MITVKSALAPGLVAIWERHPDHPEGEIYIADDKEYQVASTALVRAALGRGVLVEVKAMTAAFSDTAPPLPQPPQPKFQPPAKKRGK